GFCICRSQRLVSRPHVSEFSRGLDCRDFSHPFPADVAMEPGAGPSCSTPHFGGLSDSDAPWWRALESISRCVALFQWGLSQPFQFRCTGSYHAPIGSGAIGRFVVDLARAVFPDENV